MKLLERAMPPAPHPHERVAVDGTAAMLPALPISATTARQLVRRLLPPHVTHEQRATAELLTTELVTNAVVHARTPCELRVRYPRDGVLRVEVTDGADGSLALQPSLPTDIAGRGLCLVDALATRWGSTPTTPGGKTVWFEAPLSAPVD